MIENHVLDFTIQFNFTAILGYIVSVFSATIEKGSHRKVLERSYVDLKDSFCVYSPGVRKVDVFIPISIEYHKEPIIMEIERKLVNKGEGGSLAKEISNVVA